MIPPKPKATPRRKPTAKIPDARLVSVCIDDKKGAGFFMILFATVGVIYTIAFLALFAYQFVQDQRKEVRGEIGTAVGTVRKDIGESVCIKLGGEGAKFYPKNTNFFYKTIEYSANDHMHCISNDRYYWSLNGVDFTEKKCDSAGICL